MPTTLNLAVAAAGDDGLYGITPHSYFSAAETISVAGAIGGNGYGAWFRFTGVSGLSGATITAATLSLWGGGTDTGTPLTKIRVELATSPANPSNQADAEGRTKTTAKADWDSPGLSVSAYTASPSLVSVIQELADSYDPTVIIVYWENDGSAGSNYANAVSHNGDSTHPAKLDITYTTGVSVTPSTLSLTASPFAPSTGFGYTPNTLANILTAYAPSLTEAIDAANPQTELELNPFAPLIAFGSVAQPDSLATILTAYAPLLLEQLTPATLALVTELFAPTFQMGTPVTPDVLALTLAAFAPSLLESLTPDVLATVLTGFAPVAAVGTELTPGTLALTLATFAILLTESLTPSTLAAVLTGFAPTVMVETQLTPDPASLITTGFAPLFGFGYTPGPAGLVIATYAPTAATIWGITKGRGIPGGLAAVPPLRGGLSHANIRLSGGTSISQEKPRGGLS